MPNTITNTKKPGITISVDNPFREDVEKFIRNMKERNRIIQSDEVTVHIKRSYVKGAFTKIYQNRELLDDLSPEACKLLIHIALNMNYDEETVQIHYEDINMYKRKISRGLVELMGKRILSKHKREWYWVNLTLLISGTIRKED